MALATKPNEWGTVISSTLSAVVASSIATPFDVVKNYGIYQNGASAIRVASHIRQTLGWKGFWTGFPAACATHVPSTLVFFEVYQSQKARGHQPFIAGVHARTLAALVTLPAEFARTALQAHAGDLSFKELCLKTNPIHKLRLSFGASMLRDVPFSAIHWQLTETLKSKFNNNTPIILTSLLSGAAAAAVATTVTHPCDVVKTIMQGSIYSEESWRPVVSSVSNNIPVYIKIIRFGRNME